MHRKFLSVILMCSILTAVCAGCRDGLDVPGNVKATAAGTTITVTWSKVENATGYDIEVDKIIKDNGGSTTYIHSGLVPGSTHTYRVRAKNSKEKSEWSAVVTQILPLVPPDPPQNIATTVTDTSITVKWDAVAGATGYDIEADGTVKDNGNKTTYEHMGLQPGSTHTYKVRARNTGGTGQWSPQITGTTLLEPLGIPENISAAVTSTSITLTWDAVDGAENYDVEADNVIIYSGSDTTYSHTGLTPGTQHTYRVRSRNGEGSSEWSPALTRQTMDALPGVPANVEAAATTTSITLTWSFVLGATGYDVEADGKVTDNGADTTYTHAPLTPGTSHTYRVRAKNSEGFSNWSETITKQTLTEPLGVPANLTASAASTSITLTWDAVTGATGYDVEKDGTVVSNGKNTTYTHSNLTPNTEHRYRVRAKNANGTSDWTETITVSTLVDPATDTGLRGEYYDNMDFTDLRLTRNDGTLNFDWGTGSPDPSIYPTTFSIRWTGKITPKYNETYTFYTQTYNGVKVWVNGLVIIDTPVTAKLREGKLLARNGPDGMILAEGEPEYGGTITLEAGKAYDIKVEYQKNTGTAALRLLWESPSQAKQIVERSSFTPAAPPSGNGTGLVGEYFNNIDFTESGLKRTDSIIDFNWGINPPDAAIQPDTFSVVWTGVVEPRYAEKYTFYTQADNGVKLWVNGKLLVDKWLNQTLAEYSGNIDLIAGKKYDIRMEYCHYSGSSSVKLLWSSPSQVKQIIPRTQLYPIVNGNGTGLKAEYYKSVNFTNFKTTRIDKTVNLDWSSDSSDPALQGYPLSVRWTGQLEAKHSEEYTLYTYVEGGVRLWLDNQLLIDKWADSTAEYARKISLTAGRKYDIKVEFAGYGSLGEIALRWASASQPKQVIPQSCLYPVITDGLGTGLSAEYYDNIDLTNLKLSRKDGNINFSWGTGSPDSSIGNDTFSVRWTGKIEPKYTEEYTFYTVTDDGARLWVNGQLLIDKWVNHSTSTEYSGKISLTAGQKYDIRMEYYEDESSAAVKLLWSSPSQAKEVIPSACLYPMSSQGNGTGLKGEYYGSPDFTNLKITRADGTVDFNWESGSPDATINPDNFSVMWTGHIESRYTEKYTFYIRSSDAVSLWINNQLVINKTEGQSQLEYSGMISLVAGKKYPIKIQYYEHSGNAGIQMFWSSASQTKEIVPQSQLYSYYTGTGTGLRGDYYDNTDLTSLKLTRTDSTIDFYWASLSPPDSSMGSDKYSIRWTGQVEPKFTETYAFYVQVRDGVRLWVNNQLLVDKWVELSEPAEYTGTINLTAQQKYNIKIEYFNYVGNGTAKLLWASASQPKEIIPASQLHPGIAGNGTGLTGEYFDNIDFTNLKLIRTDRVINFRWLFSPPVSSMANSTYSIRWTGKVEPKYTETYTFYTQTADGVRLWVNNQLLIDRWVDQDAENSGTINLTAGQKYDIKMEYYNNTGGAEAKLLWSSASEPKEVIPQTQLYPADLTGTSTGIRGEYYDNMDFTNLKLTRTESTVNYSWGTTPPDPSMASDTYSVRWTGQIEPEYSEIYTFYVLADNGVRLWVNGRLLIDKWTEGAAAEYSGSINLSSGKRYPLRLEYCHKEGSSAVRLMWSSPSRTKELIPQSRMYPYGGGTGLRAEYYNGVEFNEFVLSRVDSTINFDWKTGSPDPRVDGEYFSVIWRGMIEPRYTETYTIYTETLYTDNGVRLWIDGQMVIDQWTPTDTGNHSGTIELIGGKKYAIRLEYHENTGQAGARLLWSSASQPKEIIPRSRLYYPMDFGNISDSAQYTANCTAGKEFDVALTAANMPDHDRYVFSVTYNPAELEVADLSALTAETDMAIGDIPDTALTVTQFVPGAIRFILSRRPAAPGKLWSGTVNIIRFRPKISGNRVITYRISM